MPDRILENPPTGSMPATWGGKPAIWLAWTGTNPLPDLLGLCVASVRRHNGEDFAVNVVTPRTLNLYLDPHPAYEYLSLVHRADYLRLTLLHHYGGVYLDMDTIGLRSFSNVYADLSKYDIITYNGAIWGEVFGVGVFGPTRRDSVLTRAWSESLNNVLDRRYDDLVAHRERDPTSSEDCLGWSEILRDVILPVSQQLVQEERLSARLLEPTWGHFAVGCPGYDELFVAGSPHPPDTEVLMLNHALFPDSVRRMSALEVLSSHLGICRLLQQSLGLSEPLCAAVDPSPDASAGISPVEIPSDGMCVTSVDDGAHPNDGDLSPSQHAASERL